MFPLLRIVDRNYLNTHPPLTPGKKLGVGGWVQKGNILWKRKVLFLAAERDRRGDATWDVSAGAPACRRHHWRAGRLRHGGRHPSLCLAGPPVFQEARHSVQALN